MECRFLSFRLTECYESPFLVDEIFWRALRYMIYANLSRGIIGMQYERLGRPLLEHVIPTQSYIERITKLS